MKQYQVIKFRFNMMSPLPYMVSIPP